MGMGVGGGRRGGNDEFDDDDGHYQPMAEINITPFVDVMLVLLIIFMVAAPLLVQGVPVNLPSTSAATLQPQPKKPMIVSLTEAGQLFIRKEPVTRDSLIATLAAIRQSEGDTVVYVRAPKTKPYGEVMDLLGVVGESGYKRVSLLSQPKQRSAPAATDAN